MEKLIYIIIGIIVYAVEYGILRYIYKRDGGFEASTPNDNDFFAKITMIFWTHFLVTSVLFFFAC